MLKLLIYLFFSISIGAQGAELNRRELKHVYCIPSQESDLLAKRLVDHWSDRQRSEQVLLPTQDWTTRCGESREAGLRIYLTESQALETRELVESWGYLLVEAEPPPKIYAKYSDPKVLAIFNEVNDRLRVLARALMDPMQQLSVEAVQRDEVAFRRQIDQLGSENIPSEAGILLARERSDLTEAARDLEQIHETNIRQELNLAKVKSQPGFHTSDNVPPAMREALRKLTFADWENFKKSHPHLQNIINSIQERQIQSLMNSPEERDLEARIAVIETFTRNWNRRLGRMDPLNLETRELMAYGFLMAIGELESLPDDDGQPIFRLAEFSDVWNRSLVNQRWITMSNSLGAIQLELTRKLSRFPGLIPYLRLALGARLGQIDHVPPSEDLIALYYDVLPGTLEFQKVRYGLHARSAHIPAGPLASPGTTWDTDVGHGLRFIDQWFESAGLPIHNWSEAKGISMEVIRAKMSEARKKLCENALKKERP